MNKIYLIFILSFYQLHCMELQTISNENSSVPSLKSLAIKKYVQNYKEIPDKTPEGIKDILKIYLPTSEDSVVEQYSRALISRDQEQIKKLRNTLTDTFIPQKKIILIEVDSLDDYKNSKKRFKQEIEKNIPFFKKNYKEEYKIIRKQLSQKNFLNCQKALDKSNDAFLLSVALVSYGLLFTTYYVISYILT